MRRSVSAAICARWSVRFKDASRWSSVENGLPPQTWDERMKPASAGMKIVRPMPEATSLIPDCRRKRRPAAVREPRPLQRRPRADLAAQRTWGTYNYIALWFSMSMEVTTYMLASSLIAGGMNWKQAVGTILLGNLIVLIPMLLNAHAGTKYGIPFPVFVRAPLRAARREYSGAAAGDCGLRLVRDSVLDRWAGHCSHGERAVAADDEYAWVLWACFLGFWLLNMAVVWRGVESIRFLQSFSAPFHADHVARCCWSGWCIRRADLARCFPRRASSRRRQLSALLLSSR